MQSILDIAVARMFPPSYAVSHGDVIDERKRRLLTVDPDAFADTCLALAALDYRPNLVQISTNVLVVVGSEDKTTPPSLSRELAHGIANSLYEELIGVGHCPQIQDPDQLFEKIGGFLDLS
jgi:3-oxoadipate enol-lactonase